MADFLTKQELLEAIARQRLAISEFQVERLVRAGAVARPEQVHVRGIRGSRSRYPAQALEQLSVIGRMQQRPRALDDLVLQLWWDGHGVDEASLRRVLTTPLELASEEARTFFSSHTGPHDAAEAAVDELLRGTRLPPWLRIALRRLDGSVADLSSVLHSLLVLAFGGTPAWEFDEFGPGDAQLGELIDRATGVGRAQQDVLPGRDVWLPDPPDPRETLTQMRAAGGFDLLDLPAIVHESSLNQLERARGLARMLGGALATIARALETMCTRDHAGVASLRLLDDRRPSRFQRVMLLRCCLVLGRLVEPEQVAEVGAAALAAAPLAELFIAFRDMLREHELTPKAWSIPDFESLPAEERLRVTDLLEKLLAAHPEWAAALEAAGNHPG